MQPGRCSLPTDRPHLHLIAHLAMALRNIFRHRWFWRFIKLWFKALTGVAYVAGALARAEWHGELNFLSDYVYRGYSKNRGNPLAQAHLDYQDPAGWFIGIGVSQVSFDDRWYKRYADVEVAPYLGWNLPLDADWRAEWSATGYIYDGKVFGKHADYAEFYAALHYRESLSGSVSLAPDAYQRNATVLNYELKYRRDLLDNLNFSVGLGYFQAGALLDEDYFYWNAGASWFLTSYVALDMRYVDVHLDDHRESASRRYKFYPRLLDSKFLFSVTVGF